MHVVQNFTYGDDVRNKKILIDTSDPEGGSNPRQVSTISGNYNIAPAIAGVSMVITASNTSQFAMENYSFYDTGKKNIGVIKKLSSIRILGLMAIISYMIVILFVWMYANYGGYVYFLAGEPDPLIKYTEWLLGFMGIIVAVDLLRKEIKEIA